MDHTADPSADADESADWLGSFLAKATGGRFPSGIAWQSSSSGFDGGSGGGMGGGDDYAGIGAEDWSVDL